MCSNAKERVYRFRNLCIPYPESMNLLGEEEFPEKDFVSFYLVDKKDSLTRIEFGISEFDNAFLATTSEEEIIGEMGAMVEEMREKFSSLPSVTIQRKGDFIVSQNVNGPEVYSFAQLLHDNEEFYAVFSVRLFDNYCISTVAQSGNASKLDLYNSFLERITIINK